jgi:hypothetical protein
MDEAQQIDHLITVMQQLQEMCKELNQKDSSRGMIVGLMIAMIISTPIPDIKILHKKEIQHTQVGIA